MNQCFPPNATFTTDLIFFISCHVDTFFNSLADTVSPSPLFIHCVFSLKGQNRNQ